MWNADSYFHIGKAHLVNGKPCQDFTIASSGEEIAYAIVADGCSSGGQTDLGARIIALATKKIVEDGVLVMGMPNTAKVVGGGMAVGGSMICSVADLAINIDRVRYAKMRSAGELLGLDHSDLLATCAYVLVTPHGALMNVAGDGVVAIKMSDGTIVATKFDWANNMPFYPAYAADEHRSFIAAHGGDRSAQVLHSENWIIMADGTMEERGSAHHSLSEGIAGMATGLSPQDLSEIEFIAVFSDGVCQIDGVDWREAVRSLLAFKNTTGEFAKRRMIRFIKDAEKIGRGPLDDLSYAVIHIESKEAEDGESGKQ